MRIDALSSLEGTQGLVQSTVAATHSSVAPPLAVQDTTTWPHVLSDQERLNTQKKSFCSLIFNA